MAIILSIITVACTFAGGWFALKYKDHLHLILGFSAGAVLGVVFFDLLPEALELSGAVYGTNAVSVTIAIGFLLFMIADRSAAMHPDVEQGGAHKTAVSAGSISFHSFLDGAAIGAAFQASASVGWVVAFAVLAHKFSDGINIIGVVLKNKGTSEKAIRWLITASCAPIAGAVIMQFIQVSPAGLGLILALFCGFFLYIGASDLLPESHHRHPTLWTTLATIVGGVVLYIAITLVS